MLVGGHRLTSSMDGRGATPTPIVGQIRTADMTPPLAPLRERDVGHGVASAALSVAMHPKVVGWSGVGGSLKAHNLRSRTHPEGEGASPRLPPAPSGCEAADYTGPAASKGLARDCDPSGRYHSLLIRPDGLERQLMNYFLSSELEPFSPWKDRNKSE